MTSDRTFKTPKVRGPSSSHDRKLFDWVGGSDGATNDDVYKPKLKFRDDYPIEYSCEDAVEDGDISEVWFMYDYEISLDPTQDPTETRRAFEWSVLWNVGVELGLYNCSLDTQTSEPNERRRVMEEKRSLRRVMKEQRSLDVDPTTRSLPSSTRVVALGNDQEDQLDMEAGEFLGNTFV